MTVTAVVPSVCDGCGRNRTIISRRAGQALCGSCYNSSDVRPHRCCGLCGKVGAICVRAKAGRPDICVNCYDLPVATCVVCGRTRPCARVSIGTPTCLRCVPRASAACAHCGKQRAPSVRWAEGPVCDTCYTAALRRRGICAGCGTERRLVDPPGPGATHCCDCSGAAPMLGHTCGECGREDKLYERGRCDRCALARRTAALMAGPDGTVPAILAGVHDTIVASPGARKALNWVRQGAGAPILAELAYGTMALTHEALDAHPKPRAANHVRQMLVAHGVLGARDDRLVALERLTAATIAGIDRPEDRHTVATFATWRVLRRARRRADRNTTERTAISHARNQVIGAVRFLDWLAAHDLTLASCAQSDLEVWLTTGPASRHDVHHFLKWTTARRLSPALEVAPLRSGPGGALDAEQRWAIIRGLLRDSDIDVADRVAGCFVLLYAQPLSRVAVMTTDQVVRTGSEITVRFGSQPVTVPDPLAGHLDTLVTVGRSHHIGIGSTAPSQWLFPGHLPGRPITALRLGQRLSRFGIDARAARRSAQAHLGTTLPSVILAEMLRVTIKTATDWVHDAGGDWSNYAAITARGPKC